MRRLKPCTIHAPYPTLWLPILLLSLATARAQNSPEDTTAAWSRVISVETVSKYLWRGTIMHNGPAIQPSLEFSRGDLIFGVWASYNMGRGRNRNGGLSDLYPYIQYSRETPYLRNIYLNAGFTVYTYPRLYLKSGVHRFSPETSIGLSLDIPGEPTLTFYNDFFYDSFWEVGLTHLQPLWGGLALQAGALMDYSREENKWTAITFNLSPVLERSTLFSLHVYYQMGLSTGYENTLFLGAVINLEW